MGGTRSGLLQSKDGKPLGPVMVTFMIGLVAFYPFNSYDFQATISAHYTTIFIPCSLTIYSRPKIKTKALHFIMLACGEYSTSLQRFETWSTMHPLPLANTGSLNGSQPRYKIWISLWVLFGSCLAWTNYIKEGGQRPMMAKLSCYHDQIGNTAYLFRSTWFPNDIKIALPSANSMDGLPYPQCTLIGW